MLGSQARANVARVTNDDRLRERMRAARGAPVSSTSAIGRTRRTAASMLRASGSLKRGRGGDASELDAKAIERLTASLGELKGIAMKMGQILSYVDLSLPGCSAPRIPGRDARWNHPRAAPRLLRPHARTRRAGGRRQHGDVRRRGDANQARRHAPAPAGQAPVPISHPFRPVRAPVPARRPRRLARPRTGTRTTPMIDHISARACTRGAGLGPNTSAPE
jgi:hypothetical protein